MGKMTYEEALKKQKEVKANIKEQNDAIKAFKKENKITAKNKAKGDVKKELSSLQGELDTLKDNLKEINVFIKENKPKTERKTKYSYPDWCQDSEKRKKYRTLARSGVAEKDITEKMVLEGKRAVTPKKEKKESPKKGTKKTVKKSPKKGTKKVSKKSDD